MADVQAATTTVEAPVSGNAIVRTVREIAGLRRHRDLILTLTSRELRQRYAGSGLGVAWAVLHPLAIMSIYTIVFTVVFRIRPPGMPTPFHYVIYVMTGLMPWLAISEAANKATISLTTNVKLLKQVIFPIEILPVTSVLASLFGQAVAMSASLIMVGVFVRAVGWTLLLLPLAVVCQMMFLAGLAWLLAVAGAAYRDLKEIVQVVLLGGIYFTPAVYTIEMAPGPLRPLLLANPITHLMNMYRDCFLYGFHAQQFGQGIQNPWSFLIFPLIAVAVCMLGWRAFYKAKLIIVDMV